MYQQTSFLDRLRSFFGSSSALPKLILINVIIWILIRFLGVFAFLFSSPGTDSSAALFSFVTQWLAVPADLGLLLLKPWTPFTYMFLHIDFLHLLFNMLWLFWFGQIFLQYLNNRQLVFTYIAGGIAGALLFILFYNIFPAFESALPAALALGASASVLAIVVAIAFYVPNYTIYLLLIGPVKIKYVALFTIVIDFFMIRSGNAGGHIAHLGGAALGFLYISLLSKGTDLSAPFIIKKFGGIFGSFHTQKKKPFRNVYTSDKPLTDDEYNYQKVANQKKIDSILEKIKRSGYDSLSKEEKELLFSSSRK
ncbi:MAG: rhomboid family intramembrane serine protease [Bacteroidales bacterium]|nr:rhomboid family intramembrane serine protease [Bacteroidales bacterium]